MNAALLIAFGLLCAGIGAALTAFPYWRVLERERQGQIAAERLRRALRSVDWTEARW